MRNRYLFGLFIFISGIIVILLNVSLVLFQNKEQFSSSYQDRSKAYEKMFDFSQYKRKNPTYIITDNIVYAHAAQYYVLGGNPTYINPETPPLGKYIIGFSILLFQNENVFNLLFFILALILLFILSQQIFHNKSVSIIPPSLLSLETLYKNQITISPQLDIMQLVFLLLGFIFLYQGMRSKKVITYFLLSSFFIGCFISTKFFATGALVLFSFLLSIIILYRRKTFSLVVSFVLVPCVLLLSYMKLFLDGYSIREVLGVQRWVLEYNSGHLDAPPFVVLDLILFNRWHTWWGDRGVISDSQWSFAWPFLFMLCVLTIIFLIKKSIKKKSLIFPIMIWVVVYFSFLCIGHATSRYFLILVPFMYILSTYGIISFLKKCHRENLLKLFSILFFVFLSLHFLISPILANERSAYVLPYPGFMPGNKFYSISQFFDHVQGIFSFGEFAQIKYNSLQSDKYLVEAKTLFEYQQYPLALRALKKSDSYFIKIDSLFEQAKKHGKNISEKEAQYLSQKEKHLEVLQELLESSPTVFIWHDEKQDPVNLKIKELIKSSMRLRK